MESSSWLGRTAGWSERTWVCVRRNNARSWLVGYLWRAVILKFWVWVIRDHSWDHSWILPLEIQKRSKKLRSGFHFPYWLKLRLRPQCNCRPIGVICCPLPSDQGFNNIRDHSYSEFPCCFFDWDVFLVVVFVGVFLFLVLGCLGGHAKLFFLKSCTRNLRITNRQN